MSTTRGRAWLALSVLAQASVTAGSAMAARQGAVPSVIVFGIALSFVPYAATLSISRASSNVRWPGLFTTVITFALGSIWLSSPPTLSDDLYRYIWEGRLWLEGLNPYAVAPDDPSLVSLRNGVWASINNKPLGSIYPPLSQLLFAIAAWLGGSVLAVQLLALSGLAFTVGWIARLTGDSRIALAVGLNPLLSAESALNGHFDIIVGAALLTAGWALSQHRFAKASIAVCVAVGLKAVGLVALPLLWRRSRALLAATFVSALLLVPLVAYRAPGDAASGTSQFATRWQGNESIFALVDWSSRSLFPASVAGLVPRVVVAMILVAIVAAVIKRSVPALQAVRILVWSVLLLSPQVHPWYLGWLLPLDLAAGGRAALVWTGVVLCAYAPLDAWVAHGVWEMPTWLQMLEYSVVALALFFDFRRDSKILG